MAAGQGTLPPHAAPAVPAVSPYQRNATGEGSAATTFYIDTQPAASLAEAEAACQKLGAHVVAYRCVPTCMPARPVCTPACTPCMPVCMHACTPTLLSCRRGAWHAAPGSLRCSFPAPQIQPTWQLTDAGWLLPLRARHAQEQAEVEAAFIAQGLLIPSFHQRYLLGYQVGRGWEQQQQQQQQELLCRCQCGPSHQLPVQQQAATCTNM
jgi:hypothetical protein